MRENCMLENQNKFIVHPVIQNKVMWLHARFKNGGHVYAKRFKSPAFGPSAIWDAQTYNERSIKGSQYCEGYILSTNGQ